MKDNANLIITAVVLMAFLVIWDKFVVSRYAPPHPAAAMTSAHAPAGPPTTGTVSINGLPALPQGSALSTVELEANGQNVTVVSQGARIESWKMRELDHWVEFVVTKDSQRPLETFPDLNFVLEKKSDHEAVFTADHPAGYRIVKTLTLASTPPFDRLTLAFTNPGKTPVNVNASIGWGKGLNKHVEGQIDDKRQNNYTFAEMRAVGYASIVRSWHAGLISNRTIDRVDPGPFEWVGVDNNHFLAAFLTTGAPITDVHVTATREVAPAIDIPLVFTIAPGETKTAAYDLYVGPKRYSDLVKLDRHLAESVNFGFFGVISKFLLVTLQFIQKWTGNYGWAIILWTIAIQLCVFPLTRQSLREFAKMKVVQPELKVLQEKYKGDVKRLQIEQMNLYKKHNVRMMGMGGCLPMLIQFPIFFALYQTLRVVYELRGAPWILWIHNLALPDPMHVLPILAGLGMFAQQKMNSVTIDPAQAKMMFVTPVMITFMFFNLPAGFVLYSCVQSMMSIIIQRIIRPPAAELKPAV